MAGIARFEAQLVCQTPTETEKPLQSLVSLAYTKRIRATVDVVDGASEQQIIAIGTQGLTTITGFLITANGDVSVTLGAAGSNVPVPLQANCPYLVAGTSLTALSISNSSGATVSVTYDVVGN